MISRVSASVLALLVFLTVTGSVSRASTEEFGIVPGSFAVRMFDAEGNPESRAGSHPDRLQVDFAFEGEASPESLEFEMPPGFGGDPGAVPECSRRAREEGEECPPQTQVGIFKLGPLAGSGLALPIYRLEPEPGELAAFGSKPGIEFRSTIELRPPDFGVTFVIADLPEFALSEGHIEMWGIPADHQEGTALERRPFLTAPSTCGPLVFTLRARSRQQGAPWLSANAETAPPLDGCEGLAFSPRLGLQLSDPVADSPTGLRMELTESEKADASELANAQLKDVTIELPAGLTVSPGGAAGLGACSDAQFDLSDGGNPACPASSKVGSVEVASPVFGRPLSGTIYLGEERAGERFRLFVVVPGSGFALKFVGALHADPVSGRLSATLLNLPQVMFSRLSMSFDGGPTSLLASPLACGPAATTASLVPYGGGPQVNSSASVEIASRGPGLQCPGPVPFAPGLLVESSNRRAGQASSFSATLRRDDGELLPRRFAIALPPGLSAALGSVPVCSASEAAASACPAASRVGAVLAEAGPGPVPATLPGDAYLTGPYHRAPFGLLIEISARLGPFDLGTIAFRVALDVDERTGRVTVSSDPVPDVIEGVQVRLQSIELSLDRPGFIRNPTSCRQGVADGTVEATSGVSVSVTSRLETVGCRGRRFRPRFRLALQGSGRKHGNLGVAVRVLVRMGLGETGLRAMRISLPRAVKFDVSGLGAICSLPDARRGECPTDAQVGTVVARSPLLGERLSGAVNVVDPGDDGQPDVWLSLAQGDLRAEFEGSTEIDRGHFVAKLTGLPDIPFSVFTMRLGQAGGGIFSLTGRACTGSGRNALVSALFVIGQDGARRKMRLPVGTRERCRVASRSRPGLSWRGGPGSPSIR